MVTREPAAYTVLWYDPQDRKLYTDIVMAPDPNDAVVKAAVYHLGPGFNKDDVELLCVIDGPASRVVIERDDRFRLFVRDNFNE
jgi:hypothetical protein